MEIETHCPPAAALSNEILLRLSEAGEALLPEEMRPFALTLRGEDGALVAACAGEIAFASAHVAQLWVSESRRGQGLGAKMLAAAETFAKESGCTRLHLETRNPRARVFYEKQGYRVFGELPNYAGEKSFCYLEKPLW